MKKATASLALCIMLAAGCHNQPPPSIPHQTQQAGYFRDVAVEAGIQAFSLGHHGKTPLNILETLGHGCAFLDFDQDGWLDILLIDDHRCTLYWNDHHGKFITEGPGLSIPGLLCGVAVGDFDNDGLPDFLLTGYGVCRLYHNLGDRAYGRPGAPASRSGVFEDITEKAGIAARGPYDLVTAAAFVDLDSDGRLDLFAGRYIQFTPDSQKLCDYHGVKAACGVSIYPADKPIVYRSQGAGKFADSTKAWGFDTAHGRCLGVAVRAPDAGKGAVLFSSNDELACDLFVPQGNRYANIGDRSGVSLRSNGATQAGMGADWADFNGDGRQDLFVANYETEPDSLYRNDGKEMYTEVSARLGIAGTTEQLIGWTAKFFDYDNDGWPDLFITNGHTQDNVAQVEPGKSWAQPLLLFHNEAGQLFRDVSSQIGFGKPIAGRGAAFGDYDNDGRVDILVINEDGVPLLLHNESPPQSWIGIRLIGKRSNRDGIGARVTIEAAGRKQVRDHSLCGGYLSAHDPRLHFGLGNATKIDGITIRWPSGIEQTVKQPHINGYMTIRETKIE